MASSLSAGTAYVDLTVGKTDTLTKGVQSAGKDAGEKGGSSFKDGFMDTAKSLVGPLVGLFAIDKIKDFIGEGIKGAEAAQQASRLTAQVIQSTGQAANVSSEGVDKLSASLSAKTAVDDDVIHSGANLMLTFTNVKNAAGAGNDIFNQSIGIANDMSKALGQDMKSSVMQLGKALNDPVKGLSALQRVGVSFTDQQKEQVKAMVASNNIMGAQKIVVGELNREFGGAAAAMADPIQRVKIATDDLGKSIGGLFLGPMKSGASVIADLEEKAIGFFEGVQEKEGSFLSTSRATWEQFKNGWSGAEPPPLNSFAAAFWHLGDNIKAALFSAKEEATKIFQGFTSGFQISGGLTSLTGIFSQLAPMVASVMTVMNPFGLLLKSLEPLLPQIATLLGGVAGALISGLQPAFAALQAVLPSILGALTAVAQALLGGLSTVIQGLLPILPVLGQALGQIAQVLGQAITQAVQILMPVIQPLMQLFSQLLAAILPPLNAVIGVLVQAIGAIMRAIAPLLPVAAELFTTILRAAMPIIQALLPIITLLANIIGVVLTVAIQLVVPVIQSLLWVLVQAAEGIRQAFGGIAGFIGGVFSGVVGAIRGPVNAIIDMVNFVIGAIDSISVDTPFGHIGFSIPRIPHMAMGGIIEPVPGGRTIQVAEAGEAEAIIPLSKLRSIISSGSAGGSQGPQVQNTITINATQADPTSIFHVFDNNLTHMARAL